MRIRAGLVLAYSLLLASGGCSTCGGDAPPSREDVESSGQIMNDEMRDDAIRESDL